jgi:hypothetical protein
LVDGRSEERKAARQFSDFAAFTNEKAARQRDGLF